MESFEKENQKEKNQRNSAHEKISIEPEHKDAINFILKLESVWDYFRTCIIAECENCWIINGRTYKKELET